MSTGLAIASVTAVLQHILHSGLTKYWAEATMSGSFKVTASPPDRAEQASDSENLLNLFMYQVTPNQGWRNVDLPCRDMEGTRISNPPLALDLHYLLIAYGKEPLLAEILLGYGMQSLHETPLLARETIRQSLLDATTSDGVHPPVPEALLTSELAEQIEQIKVTPELIDTEAISKLWAAFQSKYRPTAAYQASVVLIESRRSTRSALPVRHRYGAAIPFQRPFIKRLVSQENDDAPILAGHNLVVTGERLQGDSTVVTVGGHEVIPRREDVSDTQIIVQLPPGLAAGIQGVQVVHRILLGSPPELRSGIESNLAAFVLRPELVGTPETSEVQADADNLYSGKVDVTVTPAVGVEQRIVLLLNEPAPESPPGAIGSAYSFQLPAPPLGSPPGEPGENIHIPFSRVKEGTYAVRVQIDGAESPLAQDTTGRYSLPQVSIP